MTIREKDTGMADKNARFVADYLEKNPEFLKLHPQVLEKLYLPHHSGAAVSLVEKQQAVLRERNTELRTQLGNLLDSSKTNDELFDKARRLILDLVAADSVQPILAALQESFHQDFNVAFSSLVLLDSHITGPGVIHSTLDDVKAHLPDLLEGQQACGILRPRQMEILFALSGKRVGSAVALPLRSEGKTYGILALGNANPNHYHNGMDSLFLGFIADVLNLVLYRKL
jgi:uncharacterized protein